MIDIDIDAAIALEKELRDATRTGDRGDNVSFLVEAVRKAGVHLTSENAVDFDEEEAKALDHLKEYAEIMEGFGLAKNSAELTAAMHVLQGFLVQRMLHRLNPERWTDWYKK